MAKTNAQHENAAFDFSAEDEEALERIEGQLDRLIEMANRMDAKLDSFDELLTEQENKDGKD